MRKLLLLVPLLLLIGCKDPYGACVKADADIAQAVNAGLATVTQLNQQGLITNTEALNVAGYFEFVNQGDEAFGTCAQAAHKAPGAGVYTACVTTFNTTLNNPAKLALIHVNNPNASATINAIVAGFNTAVTALSTALGGK